MLPMKEGVPIIGMLNSLKPEKPKVPEAKKVKEVVKDG
jgi:hypothetical protein